MEVHNLCTIYIFSIYTYNKLIFLYSFFQKTMTGVNGNKTRHHFITSSKEEMIEEIHLNPTTTTTSTILSSHNTQCSKIHKKVPNFFFVKISLQNNKSKNHCFYLKISNQKSIILK